MTMSDEKLKPCPFCGGEAKRFTIGDDEPNNAGGDCIGCTKCGASSHVEFGRKENLVSRWNTRPSIVPSSEVVERLRSLVEESLYHLRLDKAAKAYHEKALAALEAIGSSTVEDGLIDEEWEQWMRDQEARAALASQPIKEGDNG